MELEWGRQVGQAGAPVRVLLEQGRGAALQAIRGERTKCLIKYSRLEFYFIFLAG